MAMDRSRRTNLQGSELFDSFDPDGSGEISFRELNRMLRRSKQSLDDERKARQGKVSKQPAVEVANIQELRRSIAQNLRASNAIGTLQEGFAQLTSHV